VTLISQTVGVKRRKEEGKVQKRKEKEDVQRKREDVQRKREEDAVNSF